MTVEFRYKGKKVGSALNIADLLIADLVADAFDLAIETAIVMANEIQALTPRRTGVTASNWSVATDGNHPAFNPAKLGEHPVDISGIGTSGVITIDNPTPWIGDLEFGSSEQAPNGMVRLTAMKAGPLFFATARGFRGRTSGK